MMPRRRKQAAAEEQVSALPEKFEVFEETMKYEADEIAPLTVPKQPVSRPRMVEKTWGGKPMWECPACGETTFDARVVNIHVCKKPRFA